jgi:hypothetical protein
MRLVTETSVLRSRNDVLCWPKLDKFLVCILEILFVKYLGNTSAYLYWSSIVFFCLFMVIPVEYSKFRSVVNNTMERNTM